MSGTAISRLLTRRRTMQEFLARRLSAFADRLRPAGGPAAEWARDRIAAEQVEAAYRCVLGRPPDSQGLAHWKDFLASGGGFHDLLRRFVRSEEFLRRLEAHRGAPKPGDRQPGPAEVQAVYRCLLGREADPEGQGHWVAFLRNRGSLQDLLSGFLRSVEFAGRLDAPPLRDEWASVAPPSEPLVPATLLDAPVFVPPSVVAHVPAVAMIVAPKRKFAVMGNCQSVALMRCLQALTGFEMPTLSWTLPERLLDTDEARANTVDLFSRHEKVFIQPAYWEVLSKHHPEFENQVILYPAVGFMAYHPDVVYVRQKDTGIHVFGPCHDYQSSIIYLGWQAGLSAAQTLALFNSDIFEKLGFFDGWEPSVEALMEEGKAAEMDLGELLESWASRGSFMRSMNHPKLFVSLDIARALLEKLGYRTTRFDVEPHVYDWQGLGGIWPVYPEVGEHLGVAGHYVFKLESPELRPDQPLTTMGLKEYVDESYAVFDRYTRDELECERLLTGRYQRVLKELLGSATVGPAASAATEDAKPGHVTTAPAAASPRIRFAVLGNGQAGGMARCLQALLGGPMPHEEYVTPETLAEWEAGRSSPVSLFSAYDRILIQPWIWKALAPRYARFKSKVVLFPSIAFMAFQPDLVDLQIKRTGATLADGPLGKCHSSLAFLGWSAGLSAADTVGLFRRDVLRRLGHLDCWRSAELALLEEGRSAGLALEEPLAQWKARGCFMHQPAHPKLFVIGDVARMLLTRLGLSCLPVELTEFAHDHLADDVAWPVYPGLNEVLGCQGSYEFKRPIMGKIDFSDVRVVGLNEFVEQSFAVYARYQPEEIGCRRLAWPSHLDLIRQLKESKTLPQEQETSAGVVEIVHAPDPGAPALRPVHPYAGLPAHRFWRKAIGEVAPADVDPVVATKFQIRPSTRVATAGSCFALHISKRLRERGFNFVLSESAPEALISAKDTEDASGVFSARFGYVYTARQLRQLIERAYGRFTPSESAWTLANGRVVDPFRPTVEPGGFAVVEDLERSRADHLSAVRAMFETLDVFVFTLGLTEAWRARRDGAVFPVAPGVAGGAMDPGLYEFVNFTVAEVDADLRAFLRQLQEVNPRARLILTVSPVPLVATYRERHVLVSTTYSKSVLRVAAEQVAQDDPSCDYFPSFEIITGSFNRGRYFAEDLRSVEPAGVDHVMRLFFAHYAQEGAVLPMRAEKRPPSKFSAEMFAEARKNIRTVCDEELLEAAVR